MSTPISSFRSPSASSSSGKNSSPPTVKRTKKKDPVPNTLKNLRAKSNSRNGNLRESKQNANDHAVSTVPPKHEVKLIASSSSSSSSSSSIDWRNENLREGEQDANDDAISTVLPKKVKLNSSSSSGSSYDPIIISFDWPCVTSPLPTSPLPISPHLVPPPTFPAQKGSDFISFYEDAASSPVTRAGFRNFARRPPDARSNSKELGPRTDFALTCLEILSLLKAKTYAELNEKLNHLENLIWNRGIKVVESDLIEIQKKIEGLRFGGGPADYVNLADLARRLLPQMGASVEWLSKIWNQYATPIEGVVRDTQLFVAKQKNYRDPPNLVGNLDPQSDFALTCLDILSQLNAKTCDDAELKNKLLHLHDLCSKKDANIADDDAHEIYQQVRGIRMGVFFRKDLANLVSRLSSEFTGFRGFLSHPGRLNPRVDFTLTCWEILSQTRTLDGAMLERKLRHLVDLCPGADIADADADSIKQQAQKVQDGQFRGSRAECRDLVAVLRGVVPREWVSNLSELWTQHRPDAPFGDVFSSLPPTSKARLKLRNKIMAAKDKIVLKAKRDKVPPMEVDGSALASLLALNPPEENTLDAAYEKFGTSPAFRNSLKQFAYVDLYVICKDILSDIDNNHLSTAQSKFLHSATVAAGTVYEAQARTIAIGSQDEEALSAAELKEFASKVVEDTFMHALQWDNYLDTAAGKALFTVPPSNDINLPEISFSASGERSDSVR